MYEKEKLNRLGPCVRIKWAIREVLLIVCLTVLLMFFVSLSRNGIIGIEKNMLLFYIGAGGGTALIIYLIYIELKYWNYFYMLGENEITIRYGTFSTKRIIIPYTKIQNVNVSRGVWERIVGTVNLEIETAGKNICESECVIPCVQDYKKIVDEILKKIAQTKKKRRVEP